MYPVEKINSIKDILKKRCETIAVAESVTSGHLQAALSLADEASLFFHGGLTAYNLGQKSRHLHVNPIQAEACNCVSKTTAEEMAAHITRLFSAHWGVSITGYAAIMPERGVDSLFAWYAITKNSMIVRSGKLTTSVQPAMQVQLYYTAAVIDELLSVLNEYAEG